jgi:hypothetical protein
MRLTNGAGVAVMVVGALAACSAGDIVCTLAPVPDAVLAEIRTSSGAPAAFGATLVVQDGAYLEYTGPAAGFSGGLVGPDSAQIGAAEGRGGEYTVTVIKPYWTSPPSVLHLSSTRTKLNLQVPPGLRRRGWVHP